MPAQNGPNLFDEKSVGDNVRKMPERSDKQQTLARTLDFRSESRQIHTVRDDGDVGTSEQRAILLRHDNHLAIATDPLLLESLPAPQVPALGDAGRTVANLPV